MLVLKQVPDITVPVAIHVPGEAEPTTIHARWRLHPVSKTREIMDAQRIGDMDDDALVARDLLGLEGITNEDGETVAFSQELVGQLMEIAYIRRPLVMSWFAAQQGRSEAAAKN